ncbi:MAG: LysR family transcriptional regulator [Actinomycetota bacterium]|nr:LysR family transcriptional regulator [Actinomycetota bacterium]
MDLSVQQLRMLREVAQRGTIAAAAASLGYTPSAVSQQLNGLQRVTGVAVLERAGRNVRLTDAGRELVRYATDLLADLEAARAAVERVANEVRGVLEVTVYESVAATLLVPLLERLALAHPELRLRTRQLEPDVAIDAVAAGEVDLAFTIDYAHAPAARRPRVTRFSLAEDFFHLVVPVGDPIDTAGVALADVADRAFISAPPQSSCGRCVVMACRDAGFEPDIAHQIDLYPTALRLVAAGHGVALIPDLGLVDAPSDLRVVDLDPPLSRTIQLAYRTTSGERPAIAAVRDALQATVNDLGLAQPPEPPVRAQGTRSRQTPRILGRS